TDWWLRRGPRGGTRRTTNREGIVRGVSTRVQGHPRAQSWPLLALCALSLALPILGPDDGPRLLAASLAAGRQLAPGAGPALPVGLREAASAAVGGSEAAFHV